MARTKMPKAGSTTAAAAASASKDTRSASPANSVNNSVNIPSDSSESEDDATVKPAKRIAKPSSAAPPAAAGPSKTNVAKGKGRAVDVEQEQSISEGADADVFGKRAHKELQLKVEQLEAGHKAAKRAYKQLQEQFQELHDLRHTGAEAREEALILQSDARAEAARKQVNTYAAEAEELRAEVATLKGLVAQLRLKLKASAPDALDGEDEDADMADATTFIPETQAGGSRSAENAGRLEQARLQHAEEVERLEAENAALHARNREAERARRADLHIAEETKQRLLMEAEARSKQTLQAAEQRIAEAEARAAQAEKELAFEVEQSKKHLLEQRKINGPSGSSAYAPLATNQNGSAMGVMSPIEKRLQKLQEDLTGLTLVSSKADDPPSTISYNFLLSDFRKRKALYFKLMISGDDEGGSPKYDFVPEIIPGRDDAVTQCLDKTLTTHIQFGAAHLHHFFRRLYRSMNELQMQNLQNRSDVSSTST